MDYQILEILFLLEMQHSLFCHNLSQHNLNINYYITGGR